MIKVIAILGFMFLVNSISLSAGHKHLESWYQDKWCALHEGRTEVVLADSTRVDCITDEYAIEVDFLAKWAEGPMQALHYARMTGKKPGVLFIMEHDSDMKHFNKYISAASQGGFIEDMQIWIVSPSDLE
jgi:hypothetical protein